MNRLVGVVCAVVGVVVGCAGSWYAGVASDGHGLGMFVRVGLGLAVEVVGFAFGIAGASLALLNRGPRP